MTVYKNRLGKLQLHEFFLVGALLLALSRRVHGQVQAGAPVQLTMNAAGGKPIPEDFFGVFFEEINHAGTGGLWSELVANRGFEYGGRRTPSMITPWGRVGDDKSINIMTELVSGFKDNPVTLRMDILCDGNCPNGGVGVFNPGYWGMNIEQGKTYKIVFFAKATGPLQMTVLFTIKDGSKVLASGSVTAKVNSWSRMELTLEAKGSDPKGRLQLTAN